MPTQDENEEGRVMVGMTSNYNDLNKSQSTVWKHVRPLLLKAMQDVETTDSNNCFRVADLGCATGGNSIAPLSFISEQISNTRSADCALDVYLGDLPQNAWSSVVATVTPESITKNGKRSAKNTFVSMVGRSFYEVCTPPASLDLSYSLVAVHWMKSYAGDLPSGLYATDPMHVPDLDLLQAWRDAGAKDFLVFTNARHRELKRGGFFIGAIAAPKDNGHFPWSMVGLPLIKAITSRVAPEVSAPCVLPCCWRTEADVRAGFPSELWDVRACEFHQTKDPVREQFERGEMTPAEYGKSVIESFKAVCHPTCEAALSKSLDRKEVEKLLEESYFDCIDTIAADPEQYNLDVSFWYVLARKK